MINASVWQGIFGFLTCLNWVPIYLRVITTDSCKKFVRWLGVKRKRWYNYFTQAISKNSSLKNKKYRSFSSFLRQARYFEVLRLAVAAKRQVGLVDIARKSTNYLLAWQKMKLISRWSRTQSFNLSWKAGTNLDVSLYACVWIEIGVYRWGRLKSLKFFDKSLHL